MITYTTSADGGPPHPEARIMRTTSTSSSSEYPNKQQGKVNENSTGACPRREKESAGLPEMKLEMQQNMCKILSLVFN